MSLDINGATRHVLHAGTENNDVSPTDGNSNFAGPKTGDFDTSKESLPAVAGGAATDVSWISPGTATPDDSLSTPVVGLQNIDVAAASPNLENSGTTSSADFPTGSWGTINLAALAPGMFDSSPQSSALSGESASAHQITSAVAAQFELASPTVSAGAPLITAEGEASGTHTTSATSTVSANLGDPVSDTADQLLLGPQARSTYGVSGAGLKIGIISDSFNEMGGAAADEADNALPSAANVHILQDAFDGALTTDEGRAMAQIVHSIAPNAQIYFYSGGTSQSDMAGAIQALQAAGCQIICDDLSNYSEPFFQEGGPVSAAINAAVASGVTYFTCASNPADSYYEGAFNGLRASNGVVGNNFGTATQPNYWEAITIPAGLEGHNLPIAMQWDQPFASIGTGGGSLSQLNFFIENAPGGGQILASATGNVVGQNPVQQTTFHVTTNAAEVVYLEVTLSSGPAPSLFEVIMEDDSDNPVVFDDPNAGKGSGDIIGHNDDPNAITVGAAPESNPNTMETFSGYGPGLFLFNADGTPLTTPVLGNGPLVTAVDGNTTSVSGLTPFFGTSAATPAAAAVGALVLQEDLNLTPNEIAQILQDSATPITGANPDQSGAGLINANVAVGAANLIADHINLAVFPFVLDLQSEIAAVYVGYFGRAGDPAGETYWLNALSSGQLTLQQMAASFSVQAETLGLYSFLASPSTASQAQISSFIGSVYQDLLNRAPDSGGLAYWDNYLTTNLGNPQAVGAFILDVTAGAQGQDQTTIANKVTEADVFEQLSAKVGLTFNSSAYADAHSVIAGITSASPTLLASEVQTLTDMVQLTGQPLVNLNLIV